MKKKKIQAKGIRFNLGIKSIEEMKKKSFWNDYILFTYLFFIYLQRGININILHIIIYTGYSILQH